MLPCAMAFLAPARARLLHVQALVARFPSAAAAWRSLVAHGAVPAAWLDDPRRRFVHESSDETRDPTYAPRGPHPDLRGGAPLLR